ncbi:hypothetical protein ACFYRL_30360 [Streptomyces goshikiensis]|uniref:hypothetical protein n=1 Tax=Streptomyces goshikiensis TaxID=1942 RepID=UPI0036BB85F2
MHAAALADVATLTRELSAAVDVNISDTQTALVAIAASDLIVGCVHLLRRRPRRPDLR